MIDTKSFYLLQMMVLNCITKQMDDKAAIVKCEIMYWHYGSTCFIKLAKSKLVNLPNPINLIYHLYLNWEIKHFHGQIIRDFIKFLCCFTLISLPRSWWWKHRNLSYCSLLLHWSCSLILNEKEWRPDNLWG